MGKPRILHVNEDFHRHAMDPSNTEWYAESYRKSAEKMDDSSSSGSLDEYDAEFAADPDAVYRLMRIQGIFLYQFKTGELLRKALNMDEEGNGGLAMIGNAVLKLVVVDECYRLGVPTDEAETIAQAAVTDANLYTLLHETVDGGSKLSDFLKSKNDPPLGLEEAATITKAIVGAAYRGHGMTGVDHVVSVLEVTSICTRSNHSLPGPDSLELRAEKDGIDSLSPFEKVMLTGFNKEGFCDLD